MWFIGVRLIVVWRIFISGVVMGMIAALGLMEISKAHAEDKFPMPSGLPFASGHAAIPRQWPSLPKQPAYELTLESWIAVKTDHRNEGCSAFYYQHGRCL
jgi:hypothetical protein